MKLKTRHVFKMVRIIKISGIKNEIVKMISAKGKKDAESIGIEIFNNLIEMFGDGNTENLLYDFLADIAEKTPDEIENMYIEDTKNLLLSVAEENNLKVFFRSVITMMKKT